MNQLDGGGRMLERLKDFLLGIEQRRRVISRWLNVLLLGLLQFAGGIILYNTDYTRGTPLVIQESGLFTMPAFSTVMGLLGAVTLVMLFFAFNRLSAALLVLFTIPFILYIMATIHAAAIGLQGGQGAFIYTVFYSIAMNGVWGSD